MDPTRLLGQLESQELEFKARDALERSERIGREVVGMLNAEGGVIWIGVAEASNRAVALEPIERARAMRERVLDHCIDTIVPRPRSEELAVDVIEIPDGSGEVLRLHVDKPKTARRPFAHVLHEAWRFHVRQHDRLRGMSHDDIRREFQAARRDPPNEETATAEVRADRDRFLSRAKPGLWLGIRPTGRLDLTDRDDEVIRLLTDPDASDNRHPRWSFFNRYVGVARDEASWTLGTPDGTQIAVYIDGRVELTVALDMLATRGGDNELRGLALLDHPVAVMRMLKQLLGSATGAIAADVALHGVAGWGLRPYAEDRIGHLERLERRPQDKPDILLLDPLEFRSDRLLESPDSCGLELGRRLYRGFGLTDEHLPHFADLATGTLSS